MNNLIKKNIFKICMMSAGMVEHYPCRSFESKKDFIKLVSTELMISTDKVSKILSEFIYTYKYISWRKDSDGWYIQILKQDLLPDEKSKVNGKYHDNMLYYHNLTNAMRATFKIKDKLYHFGIEELEVMECLMRTRYGVMKLGVLSPKKDENPMDAAERRASKFQHYESVEYIAEQTYLTTYRVREILHKFKKISERIPQLKKYFNYKEKTKIDEQIRIYKGTRTKTIICPKDRKSLNEAINIILEHFHIKVERRIGSIHKSKELIYDSKGYNGEKARNEYEQFKELIKDVYYRAYYRAKRELANIDINDLSEEIILRKTCKILYKLYLDKRLDDLIEITSIIENHRNIEKCYNSLRVYEERSYQDRLVG